MGMRRGKMGGLMSGWMLAGVSAVWVSAVALAQESAPLVTVAAQPAQKMIYGMDFERLWSWDTLKPEEKTRLAQVAVKDCQVQYARVAVRGAAEVEEGVFKPEAYDQILDMMTHLKAARPDLQFFGSPRPINAEKWSDKKIIPYTCYPLWITKFTKEERAKKDGTPRWRYDGFEAEKAADYMVRYVRFMKSKGFKISYLDLKNEICRLIKPADGKVMSDRIRSQLGAEAPLLIAPSSFDYTGAVAWMNVSMTGTLGTAYFDIASTHNTENKGSLEAFTALAGKAGKQAWNTELHGWTGPDDAAATNTANLFYQIRSGVSGINDWLSLGNEKKDFKMFCAMSDGSLEVMRIYYIYKQLVNTSGGGNYVPTTIPDGLKSTVAFTRGKQMTVWLLNAGDVPVKGVKVDLGGRALAGARLQKVWWGPDNGREGGSGTQAATAQSRAFVCDVAPRTLVCYAFDIQ